MKFKLIEENQYSRNKKQLPTFSRADLLTVEEAEKVPQRLRKYKDWWWLRSPGIDSATAANVTYDSVYPHGYYVHYYTGVVRPALRIADIGDYKVGSLFKFGGKWFQIVDENTAFCLSDIGEHRFDAQINDYEKSEIKRFVDNWFNENSKG